MNSESADSITPSGKHNRDKSTMANNSPSADSVAPIIKKEEVFVSVDIPGDVEAARSRSATLEEGEVEVRIPV